MYFYICVFFAFCNPHAVFWFFWFFFLVALIRKKNLRLWNTDTYILVPFFHKWKLPGEVCVTKFSLSKMTQPPNAVSTDTGFMSINIQSGTKLSFGCYEFFIPGFILGPLSCSSLALCCRHKIRVQRQTHSYAPEAWNQSLCYSFSSLGIFLLMACTFLNQFHPACLKKRDHFTVNNVQHYITVCNKVYHNKTSRAESLPTSM